MRDDRRVAILAIDCATTQVVVAGGSLAGRIDGQMMWAAGYRHGETLLPTIGRFLGERDDRWSRLSGIIVGTGPGAFTGLRVGLATAKGLAHGLGVPLVGISTGEALLVAATAAAAAAAAAATAAATTAAATAATGPGTGRTPDTPVLLLPAGPTDRIVVRRGRPPVLLPAGIEPDLAADESLVAVDLAGRAEPAAVERGEMARAGLGAALIALGAARLAAGDVDDLARLVPEYVTLPRGVRADAGEVSWSHDRR